MSTNISGNKRGRKRGRFDGVELFQCGLQFFISLQLVGRLFERTGSIEVLLLAQRLTPHQVGPLLFQRRLFGIGLVVDRLDVFGELPDEVADPGLDRGPEQAVHFVPDRPRGLFPLLQFRLIRRNLVGSRQRSINRPCDGREERLQTEVILLQNGIELVVVALSAPDPDSQKRFAGHACHFMRDQFPLHPRVSLIPFINSVTQKRRADEDVGIRRINLVARQMFADELVVRLVVVQRANDIVAERSGIRAESVFAVSIAVGIPDDIEPVLRPAFAITRTRQQFSDQSWPGIRTIVFDKGFDLFRSRRQAVQIEIPPSYEFVSIRFARRFETDFRQFRRDKPVDFVTCPVDSSVRHVGFANRLNRPPLAIFVGECLVRMANEMRFPIGPRRTHPHPASQHVD